MILGARMRSLGVFIQTQLKNAPRAIFEALAHNSFSLPKPMMPIPGDPKPMRAYIKGTTFDPSRSSNQSPARVGIHPSPFESNEIDVHEAPPIYVGKGIDISYQSTRFHHDRSHGPFSDGQEIPTLPIM